ncbi:MAG: glycoside hydrolase family 127 protein [Planctomycetota bacterium]|nr:glycoside hydrolase family 127 protein [Planctomycetota bacterium]
MVVPYARSKTFHGLSRFRDSLLCAHLPKNAPGRPLGLKNPGDLRSAVSARSGDLRRARPRIAKGLLAVTLLVAIGPVTHGFAAEAAAGRWNEKDGVAAIASLQAEPFRLQDVRLLPGPFQRAMELDRQYLRSLDGDRLLHSFRLATGLPSQAQPYGGWMAPQHNSRGEFVGLFLSACAEIYASTGDERVKQQADRVVAGFAECQERLGNGFLHTHPDNFTGRCQAPLPFWYQVHKLLAGLMDMYVLGDNSQALEIATRLADWACRGAERFNDEQFQQMLNVEHGGINEALANLYALTGQRRYLQLALRFNHQAVLGPASRCEDRLTGLHANTQIPKFLGAARQYELTGEEGLRTASTFFWDTVVRERSYVIGGHSLGEFFTPKEKLSQALGWNTCETCNTYNMLKLTRHLFCWEPRAEYADYYERALYNQILASQHPTTGMLSYFLPLGFDGRCRKEYCTPEDSFWCCTGTGIESHAKYGESIYFRQAETGLYVNLFIASELQWQARGLTLRQETEFPDEGRTRLVFTCAQPLELRLHIRHPAWAGSGFEIRVNDVRQAEDSRPGSYAVVSRTWHSGDTVVVSLPLALRTEGFRDNPRRVAILHGPLVLCAETDRRSPPLQCPAVVADEGQLLNGLRPVPGQPHAFAGPSSGWRLAPGCGAAETVLEPFYRLHGSRTYAVYWDTFTPDQWQATEEPQWARGVRLAACTVDRVFPADEQCEREHQVQGEHTATGEGRWRHATQGGWFSWELRCLPDQPVELRVTYWGGDAGGREFDLWVDGQRVATQKLENNRPGEFYEETYRLPPSLTRGREQLTLKFQAHPGRTAGGVFGCVVLKSAE